MKKKKPKCAQEAKTLYDLIAIYCRGNHHTKGKKLCPACSALQTYALQRLQHCRYGDGKNFCSLCQTHCYAPKQREEIRRVMRYTAQFVCASRCGAAASDIDNPRKESTKEGADPCFVNIRSKISFFLPCSRR